MDMQFDGFNTVLLTTKNTRMIFTDTLAKMTDSGLIKSTDCCFFSNFSDNSIGKLNFDSPGEYEVSDISIIGIQAKNIKEDGFVTMFKIINDDVTVLITGNICPNIPDKLLEEISMVDILVTPVSTTDTLIMNPTDVLKIIKSIEPKIYVPVYHYIEGSNELNDIAQQLGMEIKEQTGKLKIKSIDLTDKTQLVALEPSIKS